MDIKDVEHLAELSKLKFSDSELKDFLDSFDSIVELADTIKNADVSGEKQIRIIDMEDLREDKVEPSTPVEVLLKNSPMSSNDSFVVPRIME